MKPLPLLALLASLAAAAPRDLEAIVEVDRVAEAKPAAEVAVRQEAAPPAPSGVSVAPGGAADAGSAEEAASGDDPTIAAPLDAAFAGPKDGALDEAAFFQAPPPKPKPSAKPEPAGSAPAAPSLAASIEDLLRMPVDAEESDKSQRPSGRALLVILAVAFLAYVLYKTEGGFLGSLFGGVTTQRLKPGQLRLLGSKTLSRATTVHALEVAGARFLVAETRGEGSSVTVTPFPCAPSAGQAPAAPAPAPDATEGR